MVINNLSMDDVMLSSSMSGSAATDFCDANSLMEKKQKKKTNWVSTLSLKNKPKSFSVAFKNCTAKIICVQSTVSVLH